MANRDSLDDLEGKVKPQLERDPELDAIAAWPYPDASKYFLSGSNHPGEIRGLTDLGYNVGVAVTETAAASLEEITEHMAVYANNLLFVDSGAFSEVQFGPQGPRWPHPITDDQWIERLGKYQRIARAMKERAFLVAPDQVANQAGTLQRLQDFGSNVAIAAAHGSQVLVPVQKGRIPMAEFYAREYEVLVQAGVSGDQMMPAVPLKKDATSIADLKDFLMRTRCTERLWRSHITGKVTVESPRVHFLGRGIYSPDYRATFTTALKACPDLEIYSDSVRIRAILGSRTRGAGPLMAAQDAVKAMGVKDVFEVKRRGLILALDLEHQQQVLEAIDAGWYDSELFSSAAEHRAWLEAGRPESDEWEQTWRQQSGRAGHRRTR